MASIKDLISSLKKTKDKAISDNEGWFRGGKFTPQQNLKTWGNDISQRWQQQGGLKQFTPASFFNTTSQGASQNLIKPIFGQRTGEVFENTIKNRITDPIVNVPINAKNTATNAVGIVSPYFNKKLSLGQKFGQSGTNAINTGISALQTMGGLSTFGPEDVAFAGWDMLKAKKAGRDPIKALEGTENTGLGDALGKTQIQKDVLNIAELPLSLMVMGSLNSKNADEVSELIAKRSKLTKLAEQTPDAKNVTKAIAGIDERLSKLNLKINKAGKVKMGIKDQSSPIKTGGDDLIQEARKYKSADEFIKAKIDDYVKTTPKYKKWAKGADNIIEAYHGTPYSFDEFQIGKKQSGVYDVNGISFATKPQNAEPFSRQYPDWYYKKLDKIRNKYKGIYEIENKIKEIDRGKYIRKVEDIKKEGQQISDFLTSTWEKDKDWMYNGNYDSFRNRFNTDFEKIKELRSELERSIQYTKPNITPQETKILLNYNKEVKTLEDSVKGNIYKTYIKGNKIIDTLGEEIGFGSQREGLVAELNGDILRIKDADTGQYIGEEIIVNNPKQTFIVNSSKTKKELKDIWNQSQQQDFQLPEGVMGFAGPSKSSNLSPESVSKSTDIPVGTKIEVTNPQMAGGKAIGIVKEMTVGGVKSPARQVKYIEYTDRGDTGMLETYKPDQIKILSPESKGIKQPTIKIKPVESRIEVGNIPKLKEAGLDIPYGTKIKITDSRFGSGEATGTIEKMMVGGVKTPAREIKIIRFRDGRTDTGMLENYKPEQIKILSKNTSSQPTIKITKAGENMPQAVIKIRPEQSGLDSSPFGGLRNQQPGLSQTPQRLYTDKGQFEQPSNDIIAQAKKQIGKASETPNKSIKQTADDIYTQWIDRYNPITKATDTAKKQLKSQGAELRPEFDPTYAVRRLTGAGGIADARFKTELEPIIKEMDNLGIAKDDIDVYLANRRIKGFGDIGRDVYGADSVRSAKVVSALENKYGDSIKQIAEKLYKYQDDGFDEMIRAGFISPETAKVIKSQNPDYAPLQRVMDEVDNYLGLPTRKTMQGSQPIVKLKGSTRQIDSPLENIIGNTFKQRAAIEKNNVASQIAGLQNVAELGFKKIAKSGNDTITVWKNGQKEYWQVGEEIADVAKGLNEENMNTLLKIFTAPASLLRQGATGRNPEFMVPNVIRDQLDAGITSRYGYIPFVDYLSGLKSMLKNDEIYQKWASSGAKIDLGELSGRKGISQYFDEKTAKKGLFSWLGSAMDTMGKYSEEPTRIGLFKKAYQKTGNELLAMMESRDATVDFARMGSKMKVANSIIPFLNVGIQGFDKLIRSVKNNPGKVLLNASIYGALPAITTTLYNLIYHGEEYNEIPSYERDGNFVLIKGRNEEGTVDYVTIPKGNVIPVIANPIQSLLEYMAGNSQQSFGQFATQFFSSTLPVVGEGQSLKEVAVKTVGSNMPQLIKPITENLVNKSFYKYDTKKEETKEIVPYYLKNKEPYQQSYKFTPSMYKSIGAVLNVSPLQVQNLMEGYLAGYAKIPAQMIEIAKSISRGDEVNPNQKTLLRRFLKQTYPSSSTSKKTEEKTTPFMERVTGKAKAAESNEMELPSSINELSVLYKDASSTIKTYGDKKTKITYGLTKGELSDLQDEVDSAIKLKKQIEKEHPEAVFQIGIETYKSGGGMDVYERAKWVKQQLEGKEGKERQDLITLLTNSKVITSSVAKELGELGVKGVSGSGTKIKVGTTPKFKSPTIKISSSIPKVSVHSPSIKISMPKTSQSKVKLPTFKKANLANNTVKVKQFRQPVVKIKNG